MRALLVLPVAWVCFGVNFALALPVTQKSLSAPKAASTVASPADQAYQRALQALTADQLKAAEQAFEDSLKQAPNSAKAMLGLAEIAFRNGKLEPAGTWIQRAIQAEPDSSAAYASLGRYHALNGKSYEAEMALVKAAELDSHAVRPRIDLGDLLSSQGRLPGAVKFYQEVLSIEPQHAGAHYALGIALARQGDKAKALLELERAASLEPGNPLPQLGLARVHAGANDRDKALAALDKALARQPSLVDALMLQGDLLDAKGLTAQATQSYRKAAAAAPKAAFPHLKIAMLAQRQGETEQAVSSYKKAIAINPKQAVAYNNLAALALALESKHDLPQALAWARMAVELEPNVADYHDTLGWTLRASGNQEDGLTSLKKAAQLAPQNPEILYHLGVLYTESGDKRMAIKTLTQALAASNHFSSAAQAEKLLKTMSP